MLVDSDGVLLNWLVNRLGTLLFDRMKLLADRANHSIEQDLLADRVSYLKNFLADRVSWPNQNNLLSRSRLLADRMADSMEQNDLLADRMAGSIEQKYLLADSSEC